MSTNLFNSTLLTFSKFNQLTLATTSIGRQSIPRRTSTLERSRSVLANAHTQFVLLVNRTFVHVQASAIIGRQLEAIIARASVRSPHVHAILMAQTELFAALIHVRADLVLVVVLAESFVAVAPIRSDGVATLGVHRTHLKRSLWDESNRIELRCESQFPRTCPR